VLADGTSEPFDHLVNATGLQPPALTRTLGLATAADGAIMVDDRLTARDADGVFAAGDCIAFGSRPLPKVGVYAIRQAPILFHNLMAFLDGRPLERFTPQEHYLSIMTLGDGRGLAYRAGLWWQGRAAFFVKDWIDRRFLRSNRPDKTHGRAAPPTDASEPAEQEGSTTIKP
jgi:NADH dehydrogenase FAD-containing subunit